MTGPEGAEIRYSTDSTDPGHYSLATSGSVMVYQDSIPLPEEGETLTDYARTKQDTLWSTLVKKTFIIGNAPSSSIDNPITADNNLYCYPNPIQDNTTIKYTLYKSSAVALRIYNVIGECVATLEHGNKQKGEYTVIWNSGNNPPGIYFCVLNSDSKVNGNRIKLVKNSCK
jgi:hypothetical protein